MRDSENSSEISLDGTKMSTLAESRCPSVSLGKDSRLNNHEHPPKSRHFPKRCEIFQRSPCRLAARLDKEKHFLGVLTQPVLATIIK